MGAFRLVAFVASCALAAFGDDSIASTNGAALAAFVADRSTAMALIGAACDGGVTNSVAKGRACAVSRWLVEDRAWRNSAGRKVWAESLVEFADAAPDRRTKLFCLGELRVCGYPAVVQRIRIMADRCEDKAVMDFSRVVTRELNGKRSKGKK